MTTVYVPRDSSARSVGADQVAAAIELQAIRRGAAVEVIRNGSRGMMWLEPFVEVVTAQGRVAFGPVTPDDVAGLFDAGFLDGGDHKLGHGRTDQIPWLALQNRLTFSRVGIIDPLSVQDYQAHGGLIALRRALAMTPEQICDEVTASGLRGRGGAGFPVGVKWRTVLDAPAWPKFVTCNADEGDSGTFADRMLMEGDPFMLIEGMVIAGLAVGAHEGFIYVRSEYPDAVATMQAAIRTAY
jgi:formate dehydrogenase iron-sulfur subunit